MGKRAGNLASAAANTFFGVSQYEGIQSLQLQRSTLPNRSSASQPVIQIAAISVSITSSDCGLLRETSSLPATVSAPDQHGAIAVGTG